MPRRGRGRPPRPGPPGAHLRSMEPLQRGLVETPVPILPRVHPRSRSDRGAAKTPPVLESSRSLVAAASSRLPSSVTPFLLGGHVTRGHRISSPAGKFDHDAEESAPRAVLAKHVVDGTRSGSLRAKDQGRAEADLLELFGPDAMLGDVVDTVLGPQDFGDRHLFILRC